MKIVGERMVELAMQAWRGDYDEIIKLAKSMDIPVKYDGKVLHLGGEVNIRTTRTFPLRFIKDLTR